MQFHKFGRNAEFALTRDPAGFNLPELGEGWHFVGTVTVRDQNEAAKIGASAEEILKAVADDGFYIWKPKASAAA